MITINKEKVINYFNYKSFLFVSTLLNFINIYILKTKKKVSLITTEETIIKVLIVKKN